MAKERYYLYQGEYMTLQVIIESKHGQSWGHAYLYPASKKLSSYILAADFKLSNVRDRAYTDALVQAAAAVDRRCREGWRIRQAIGSSAVVCKPVDSHTFSIVLPRPITTTLQLQQLTKIFEETTKRKYRYRIHEPALVDTWPQLQQETDDLAAIYRRQRYEKNSAATRYLDS